MKPNEHLSPEQVQEIVAFIEEQAVRYAWAKDRVPEIAQLLFVHAIEIEHCLRRVENSRTVIRNAARPNEPPVLRTPEEMKALLATAPPGDPECGVRTATRHADGTVTAERGFTPGPPSEDDRSRLEQYRRAKPCVGCGSTIAGQAAYFTDSRGHWHPGCIDRPVLLPDVSVARE